MGAVGGVLHQEEELINNMKGKIGDLVGDPLAKLKAKQLIKAKLEELDDRQQDNSWREYLEKIPAWVEKPLQEGEFDVGVVFTKSDVEFGQRIAKDLERFHLQVTTDPDKISNTRAFVLLYSDDVASDETVLRLLTRAAERFNDGNTTIFPVVHPQCSTLVLDQIPNTLAYSLSNTSFISMICSPSLASNNKFAHNFYEKKLGILGKRVTNYVHQTTKWDISGVWLLRVVLKEEGHSSYEVHEFTIFLQQKNGKNFVGTTVNGHKIKGQLDGNNIKFYLQFSGKWVQSDEDWESDDFLFLAQINAGLKVQGTKFEGSYVDSFGGAKRSGTVSAILEDQYLSGYYKFDIEGLQKEEDSSLGKIGLVHRGSRIFSDVSGMHGLLFSGATRENEVFWSYSVGSMAGSYNAEVQEEFSESEKQIHITGKAYVRHRNQFLKLKFQGVQLNPDDLVEKGTFAEFFTPDESVYKAYETWMRMNRITFDTSKKLTKTFYQNVKTGALVKPRQAIKMTTSIVGMFGEMFKEYLYEAYSRQREIEDVYAKQFGIDPESFVPLADDEFGVCIGSSPDCASQAELLKADLEKAGIPRVTLDIENYEKSRTFIILLSAGTCNEPKLIEATYKTAVSNRPIFNIGLAEFFAIFDETKWTDKEALRNLRDALARLNQTDASTLDPANNNFSALVRRIKLHVEAPNYNVSGLWFIQCPEARGTLNFMVFITQDGQKLEANEFDGTKWEGIIDKDELVLKKVTPDSEEETCNISLISKVKEKGKAVIGRYTAADGTAYSAIGTLETDGISGQWNIETHNIKLGIVQKGDRLIVQYGLVLCQGVMSGNYAVIQILHNNERITFEGMVRNSKTGPIMSGRFYTENLSFGPFVARKEVIEYKDDGTTYDVMISYRSTDSKFINLLQNTLEEAGITCWRDRRMEVGTNWSEDITRAVRSSRGVICCISENYIKSSLCTKEILLAHDMGKIIIPLVLPTTEAKEQEFLRLVRAAYTSPHPPYTVAREIAKTNWIDFRPLSALGPDPTNALEFSKRYDPLVANLKAQLLNVRKKGCLWNLAGTWQLTFSQDANPFDAYLTLIHTKLSLTGKGTIKGSGIEEQRVALDSARLDNSVLSFSLRFLVDPTKEEEDASNWKEGVIILKVMLGIDGKTFVGKWRANKVPWCSYGTLLGKQLVAVDNQQ
eukprot:Phypoly_transcript_01054.p1 GENE.Phypoly_transcript_01054~~Phypoly_transcript_01054.p1  ORF type:complete len:1230 (+),score=212.96 Phypoly_transcript_01054:151-3690(+)